MEMIKHSIFLLLFLLIIFEISATELNISYSGNKTTIILMNCPEPGLGSYYIVLTYDPPNAKILNVSPKFISDYNIVNNTILIAGIQGKIPGPSGNIELVEIESNREIRINPILVNIKDVNGELIYHYSSQVNQTQTPVNVQTPASTPGPVPSSTSSRDTIAIVTTHTPTIKSAATPNKTRAIPSSQQISNPNVTQSNAQSQATPVTQTVEQTQKQTLEQTEQNQSSQIQTEKEETKEIPVGVEVLLVTGLFILLILIRKKI